MAKRQGDGHFWLELWTHAHQQLLISRLTRQFPFMHGHFSNTKQNNICKLPKNPTNKVYSFHMVIMWITVSELRLLFNDHHMISRRAKETARSSGLSNGSLWRPQMGLLTSYHWEFLLCTLTGETLEETWFCFAGILDWSWKWGHEVSGERKPEFYFGSSLQRSVLRVEDNEFVSSVCIMAKKRR